MKDYEEPLRAEPLDLLRHYLMVSNMVMDTVSLKDGNGSEAELGEDWLSLPCPSRQQMR